ncbi:PipA protein [Pandoraea pulmonicola]|uniref:PipA protein n=2 Tax=Pandoraea pulmonicola TaxID=93221 RepID=A0AAJ4ZC87_PANPU|nr:PipA protein [Pandoraea pulmonicola]
MPYHHPRVTWRPTATFRPSAEPARDTQRRRATIARDVARLRNGLRDTSVPATCVHPPHSLHSPHPTGTSTRRAGKASSEVDKRALFLLAFLGIQVTLTRSAADTPAVPALACARPAACSQPAPPWSEHDVATRATMLRSLHLMWPSAPLDPASRAPSIGEMAATFAAMSNASVASELAQLRLMRRLVASHVLERGTAICRFVQRMTLNDADWFTSPADTCAIAETLARLALLQPPSLHDVLSKFGLEGANLPVNVTRLAAQKASPLDILRIVQYRHGRSLDAAVRPDYTWRGQLSDDSFDEAAAIHRLSTPHWHDVDGNANFRHISACYERLLGDELAHLQLAAHLIPTRPPVNGSHGIWFDGMALRGTAGMSIDTLATALRARTDNFPTPAMLIGDSGTACRGRPLVAPASGKIAPNVTTSALDINVALRTYLRELAESSEFRFGTPLQSAATTVLRLGAYHDLPPVPMETPAQVLQAFVALRRAWLAKPRYPIDPMHVAAAHLEQSSRAANAPLSPGRAVRSHGAPDVVAFARRLMAYAPWPPPPSHEATGTAQDADNLPASTRQSAFLSLGSRTVRTRFIGMVTKRRRPSQASPRVATGDPAAMALVKAEELMRLSHSSPDDDKLRELAGALRDEWARLSAASHPQSLNTDEKLAITHDLLEELIISRPISHVVDAASRGDVRAVLDMAPFIMPAYEIEEGLRTGNSTRALNGAIRFGVDALFVWLGGVAERSLQNSLRVAVEQMRMPPFERAASATLSRIGPEFEAFEMQALDSLRHEHIQLDPYDAISDVTVVPRSYREMPLPRRVASSPSMEPLTADQFELARRRSVASLPRLGADDDFLPSSGMTAARDELLRQRETVIGMMRFLPDRRRGSLTNVIHGVGRALYCAMPMNEGEVISVRSLLNPKSAEGAAIIDSLDDLCSRSRILQALVERALDAGLGPWDVHIVDGESPRFAPGMDALILPPESQLTSRYQYESPTGKRRFTTEQAALHELLHGLTSLGDATAAGQRGPIVYLTDRIGHQAGRTWEERVAYRAFDSNGALRPEILLQHRLEATRWMHDEDMLIDRYMRKEFGITAQTHVDGEPVANRHTVQDLTRFVDALGMFDFPDRLHANFVSSPSDSRLGVTDDLRSMFERLGADFAIFRALTSLWSRSEARLPWRIQITPKAHRPARAGDGPGAPGASIASGPRFTSMSRRYIV